MNKTQLALLIAYLDARRKTARAEANCTDGDDNERYCDAVEAESAALKKLQSACLLS